MRNTQLEAVILKTNPVAEIHRGATLFTRSQGIINAMAYGAESGRGKLKGLTMPFCYGTFYLYTDPVKGNVKITDANVQSFFVGIRKRITSFYTASLWAEVIFKSFAGGGGGKLFQLFIQSLGILEDASDELCRLVSIQFLIRFLHELGLKPDTEYCGRCGEPFSQQIMPRRGDGELVCRECSGADEDFSLGALRYLRHTAGRKLADAVKVGLDPVSQRQVLAFLHNLIQNELEVPLNTLKAGRNILEGSAN
jgi:DNA repair protein RecO (recombination protein O)